MKKKWYKNKILISLICLLFIFMGSIFLVLAKYGIPDFGDLYSRHRLLIYKLPDFAQRPIYNLSMKQMAFRWQSYRKNIHLQNFFKLFPKGKFVISSNAKDKKTINCWAIVYDRYYLAMEVPFKINLMKTGIGSFEDPTFELVELQSITNLGTGGLYRHKDEVIYKYNRRREGLELLPCGDKIKFGMNKWKLLLKNSGDLKWVLPDAIKDKPLSVVYDYSQAEKSAEQGHADAIQFLARAYYDGRTVPKDYVKAMKWLKKLADIDYHYGSRWAAFFVGDLYYLGAGVKKDDVEAVKWFKKSALKQYPPAYFHLGTMYYCGFGVEKNIVEAEKWYQKGADAKHPNSCNDLAYMWAERGEKLSEAKKLIDIALSRQGNNAYFLDTLGWIYYKQKKYKEAVEELEKASKIQPNIDVIDHLGNAYFKLGKQDKAIECWKKAIELAKENDAELKTKILKKLSPLVEL